MTSEKFVDVLEDIYYRAGSLRKPEETATYIIREAGALFKKPLVLWSGGKDSTIMLYLIKQAMPYSEVPWDVALLDTGMQFRQTYEFMDGLAADWKLKYIRSKNEDAMVDGINPKDYSSLKCCHEHKTNNLKKLLRKGGYDGVFTGIRWFEHGVRSKEKPMSYRDDPPHYRVHPLLNWTEEFEWEYIKKNDIPYNPLYDMVDHDGLVYRSIGCYPCTKPTSKTGEERAGRSQDKENIMEHLRALGYM